MLEGLKSFWKEIVTEYKKKEPAGDLSPAEENHETPKWAREPEPDSLAMLTIIQSINDDGFEPIKIWLQGDSRVTGETTDNGRFHTVPDGDDLPEWYAIRINTVHEHRESLKDDLQKMIDTDLGGSFKVDYF